LGLVIAMNNKAFVSKVFICLPKPQFSPAGVIWSISGAILQHTKCKLDEYQFWHVVLPQLFNHEPYLLLVSTELLDLDDYTNCDRSILLRAANAFPQSIFIIWDKQGIWGQADSPDPSNLEIWNELETNEVTRKLLIKLGYSVN
jgi:hypothetical protein